MDLAAPHPTLVGLATALAMMTAVWLVSVVKRDAGIIDIFWGAGFVLLAWEYRFLVGADGARAVLVPILVSLWGVRLSLHILRRSRGRGEDYRYREMRERWGSRFPWASLFVVFWLQALILWIVAMPLYQVQRSPVPPGLTAVDWAALAVFSFGFVFESVGDWQLSRFKADPSNRGKLLTTGLWGLTRHPNYFGDAMVWWGLFLFAFGTEGSWWTILSPVLMTFLLMRVSGVRLLEVRLAKTKPGYEDYLARTNAFFPWFSR